MDYRSPMCGSMVVIEMGGCPVTPLTNHRSAGTDRTPGGDQFEYAEVGLLGWPGGLQ